MATLTEQPGVLPPSSNSPMPGVNGVYDQDMDAFLNLDQFTYTSAESSRPKAALASQTSVSSADFSTSDMRSASFASSGQSPIAFQAPSHQYDEHKQQTGLPPGGLAHAMTFNNNHMGGMGYGAGNQGFPMNGEMLGQMKREDVTLDFNSVPTRNPSDMDLESDNMGAVPYFLSPNNNNKSQFVDPNALGGHESIPVGSSTQVGRMYPGMHQQAAMAKAQQQKQNEFLRQQQMQQQRRMEEHVPHTNNTTTTAVTAATTPQPQAAQPQAHRVSNPVVDERISRLLQQMRQNAMNSPGDSPTPSMLPQMAKAKKDEQDMDEDERLLASEEGKKLSSKERRQLRNKVSARAFRSRRKEYIGQLESEVAARTNEVHDLHVQNRALYEENSRLTDLARMLLSSPHFSTFLDEMNANGSNGLPLPSQSQPQAQPQAPQQQPQQPPPQQQQQQHAPVMQQPQIQANVPKDANHSQNQDFQMQQNPQVSVQMAPNQGMDMSTMGFNNGGWNSGIELNYGNAPVFAVLEVPEGPVLDAEAVSGKSSNVVGSYLSETSKDNIPTFERLTVAEGPKNEPAVGFENPDVQIDESDPAFALFLDAPATSPGDISSEHFDGIPSEKESPVFELVVENESRAAANRFASLCHSMEAAFQRVSMATSHLL